MERFGAAQLAMLVAGLPVVLLQKVVQVLVLPVKAGLVDYVATRTRVDDSLCSRVPGSVVVEKSMDRAVTLQERQRFGQVHHGIQHGGIDRRARRLFQSQIGKEVHETLEDENRIAAVVERGDVLGADAALEAGIAESPTLRHRCGSRRRNRPCRRPCNATSRQCSDATAGAMHRL